VKEYLPVLGLLANVSFIANASGGLENVLTCAQLLLISIVSTRAAVDFSWKNSLILGLLLGWTALTRLDGAMFGFCLVAVPAIIVFARSERGYHFGRVLRLAAMIGIVILINFPWYFQHYRIFGTLVSDSAEARLLIGRRNAIKIIDSVLYFHPKLTAILLSVYLPLVVGFVYSTTKILRQVGGGLGLKELPRFVIYMQAIVLLAVAVIFYSCVVGAEHVGRYVIPVLPLFYIVGISGLVKLIARIPRNAVILPTAIQALAIAILVIPNMVDYYRRVVLITNSISTW